MTLAIALAGATSASLAATYSFLTVSGNGISGNAATSQFTGTNGVINVTHAFSSGGFSINDNQNGLIFPSGFPINFPGTGQVQGHLASTNYNHQSTVTFILTNYSASDTVFGIWNATNRTTLPPYRLEMIDSNSILGPPTTFQPFGTGNEDNTLLAGHQNLDMNLTTGVISAGAVINASGTHTNAGFWKIPKGIKQIIVHGDLGPALNGEPDDGVGYYFAERVVPEPGTCLLLVSSVVGLALGRRRRVVA